MPPPASPRARAQPARKVALLELLEALARAANEAASPEAAMRTCLERISEYANSSLARVAILKADSAVPAVESSMWLERDAGRFAEFVQISNSFDYAQPTGKFISVVFRDQRAVWIEDIARTFTRGRLVPAAEAGLHSAFAFPVIVAGKVAAFLEFFAEESRKADPLLLDAVGSVGAQLARLIERARAEAAQAKLAAIVEGSHDAIFSRSLDGTVLSWNAGAERMFGYTAAEMIGRHISVIAPPELAHESQRNTEALLRGEPGPPFETVRVAKDGRVVRVQISVSPIRDTTGEVAAIAAIMRDVTERERIEAERARLAAIVESSQDAIVSAALDRTVLTWNAGAERIFGYTAAEVVGRDVGFLVPEDLRHELGQPRAHVLDGRSAPPHDTERLAKDGRRVPVSISASPLRDGAGNVSGIALIYRDISERRRAEAAQARLAAIVENSNDAIISRGLDRIILTWNAAAERLFGWSAAEMIGRSVSLIIPPDQVARTVQNHALLVSSRPIPTHDAVRVTKDGRRIDVSITQFPIKSADGRFLGVSSIFRDIGELKRAQRDLERKARLSQLMESLARAANEAASAETAMQTCIRIICEYGNWTLGGVGTFAQGRADGIVQTTYWHTRDPGRFARFMHQSKRTDHTAAFGHFVGKVLREKGPVWLVDLSILPLSGRILSAAQAGLRCAFGFPVIVNGEVAAFLEFFAEEPREPDSALIGEIGSVGAQLARLIERGQAEAVDAQLAAIVESSEDAIFSIDRAGVIRTWNPGAERMLGYGAAEVLGRNTGFLIPEDRVHEIAERRAVTFSGQRAAAHETVRLAKDGRRIDVSVSASPMRDAAGEVAGVALIYRDISESKEAEEKIRYLAHYDGLTGLPNRALFYDRLGQGVALARREQHAVALLYLDLDDFKAVNDTFGHDVGDELLKAVAERMISRLRESDTIARVGGDEFIAILPKIADRQACELVATSLLDAFSPPFLLRGAQREAIIRASIGIAVYPSDAEDMESLVKAADSAMYAAKRAGNRFSFYDKAQRP